MPLRLQCQVQAAVRVEHSWAVGSSRVSRRTESSAIYRAELHTLPKSFTPPSLTPCTAFESRSSFIVIWRLGSSLPDSIHWLSFCNWIVVVSRRCLRVEQRLSEQSLWMPGFHSRIRKANLGHRAGQRSLASLEAYSRTTSRARLLTFLASSACSTSSRCRSTGDSFCLGD